MAFDATLGRAIGAGERTPSKLAMKKAPEFALRGFPTFTAFD
jgi:hypothetical protein